MTKLVIVNDDERNEEDLLEIKLIKENNSVKLMSRYRDRVWKTELIINSDRMLILTPEGNVTWRLVEKFI